MPYHSRIPAILLALLIVGASCSNRRLPDSDVLEQRIRSILELPTFEQVYRDIVFVDRERSFLLFRTMHAQVLFSIDIRVQAGIDFADGISIQSDASRKSVLVRLPRARVFIVDADESTITEYFVKSSGGSIERLDYYDEIDRIKAEILADALEREILQKAEANARNLIIGLLTSAGFEEVRFAPR